jgi:hypothetical protein
MHLLLLLLLLLLLHAVNNVLGTGLFLNLFDTFACLAPYVSSKVCYCHCAVHVISSCFTMTVM